MRRKHEEEQSDGPEKKFPRNQVDQEISTLTTFTPSHDTASTYTDPTDVASTDVASTDVASTDVASTGLNSIDVASTHIDSTDVASIHIASTDLNPTHIGSSNTGTNSSNVTASSSSTTPVTSKKIQKKIDKSRALQEFRLQQKSDKPKLCPSCKQDTHARSTSNLCPNKKKKEAKLEADEFTKQFVIKTSLKSTCKNKLFAKNLAQVVEYTNRIIYVGSLFVNFVFLKLLGNGQAIPVIEQNLFAFMFALITGNGKKAPTYLNEYFNDFCELTSLDREQIKGIGYSSLLNVAAKQYETLVRNYVHETHERRSIMYFLNTMSDENSGNYRKDLPVASRKALAY
ncbi:hypothetical protein [Parasitella parasitica]|uniref:Uncharacterized protein n=1 Tax=Parasitella parasitica TaxID=35722 RepID=A0A0B7MYU3_9FUNG|nr:hypothetical protein [Parasitella parasitica]